MRYGEVFEQTNRRAWRLYDRYVLDGKRLTAEYDELRRQHPELDHTGAWAHPDVELAWRAKRINSDKLRRADALVSAIYRGADDSRRARMVAYAYSFNPKYKKLAEELISELTGKSRVVQMNDDQLTRSRAAREALDRAMRDHPELDHEGKFAHPDVEQAARELDLATRDHSRSYLLQRHYLVTRAFPAVKTSPSLAHAYSFNPKYRKSE